jgi:predicted ATPase/DNA-binding SARP family transcriptional activator
MEKPGLHQQSWRAMLKRGHSQQATTGSKTRVIALWLVQLGAGAQMRKPLPRLTVQLLGEFRCWRGEHLIPRAAWRTAKVQTLFKVLVSERGHLFTHADLTQRLWPERDSALASVRKRISDLRRILEPDLRQGARSHYVLQRPHGYCFNAEADCWVDIEEFAHAARAGKERESAADWAGAITAYESAVQLYRGDFAGDEDEAWAGEARNHWRTEYLEGLTHLAECHARYGHFQQAIEFCRRRLVTDRYNEGSCYNLILYLLHSGDSAQALMTYEAFCSSLMDELGLRPSPHLQELYQQILRGGMPPLPFQPSAPHSPSSPPSPPTPLPFPHCLAYLPLVGREPEFARLHEHITRSKGGKGQLVLISGEAGIGKTRLMQEVCQKLREDGALVFWGRCRSATENSPFKPLAEALDEALIQLTHEDLVPVRPLWLAELAALSPRVRTLAAPLPQNPPLLPEQARWRLFEACAQFFQGLSGSTRWAKPLVIVIDDLQWATASLIDLLAYLSRRLTRASICIIGAYRSTETEMRHPLRKWLRDCERRSTFRPLMLSPLTPSDFERLWERLGPTLPLEFRRSLCRQSEGNPLALVRLLQKLFESGTLKVGTDGLWLHEHAGEWTSLYPPGMGAIVQEQVARLGAAEQHLLQLAAVIGPGFDQELLEAAWPWPELDLTRSLRQVCAALLITSHPPLHYDFSHDQIREIIYEAIGPERPSLHRRVARAIERRYAPDLLAHYAQLAYHYDCARQWPPTLLYSLGALAQAIAQYDHETALRMAEIGLRAAQLLGQSESTCTILARRADVYHRLSQRREQARDIQHLLKLIQEPGTRVRLPLQAEAQRLAAIFYRAVGRYAESVKAAEQALVIAHQLRDEASEIQILLLLGSCQWLWSQYDQASAFAGHAYELSQRLRDFKCLGDALHLLGQIHAHTGAHVQALEDYRQAYEIRKQTGDLAGTAMTLNNLANAYRALGDYQKAQEAYEQSLTRHEQLGDEYGRGRALSNVGELHGFLGDYEKALDYALQGYALHKRVQDSVGLAQTLTVLGRAYRGMGQRKEALRSFERAHKIFERLKDARLASHALDMIGSIQLDLSLDDKALSSYEAALARLQMLGARDVEIECLTGLSLAQLRLGQRSAALISTRRAVQLIEAGFGCVHPQQAFFVYYQALHANGQEIESEKYLERAYEEVMHRAQSIMDTGLRERYLTRVPMNREIVAARQSR